MSKRPNEFADLTQNSNKKPRSEDAAGEPPALNTRDSKHYYEDGSMILLVENVLFKIHASLLKAQSEVFQDMFAMPLGSGGSQIEGSTDEHPIAVPGVKAGEFRSLLKMIYLPPSSRFFTALNANQITTSAAGTGFAFYSNVARLAHRFCMVDFEKWAADRLRSLTITSTPGIITFAKKQAPDRVPEKFWLTLAYVRLSSDSIAEHNIRNMMQYYTIFPAPLPVACVLSSLHLPETRQDEPSLFGFWFLTLLNFGNQVWEQEQFTREDRIALFSAQSYLTPLPNSLGDDLVMPLLKLPEITEQGSLVVLADRTCSDNCYHGLGLIWRKIFGPAYYQDVLGSETLKPTSALGKLPEYRFRFAHATRALPGCQQNCSSEVLKLLDEDLNRLFVRLGGYYRNID